MAATVEQLMAQIKENKPKAQNFHSHVFVPIIQNLIGGFSVGLLLFFLLSRGVYVYDPTTISICLTVSLSIASIVNIYRFFGDDLIRPILIFRLGQVFCADDKIDKSIKSISVNTKDTDYANALKLIVAHYNKNLAITQKDAEKLKLNRKDYESARNILIDVGLLSGTRSNKLNAHTLDDALKTIKGAKK